MSDIVGGVADADSGDLRWEPLAKGEVQACTCGIEGCNTVLTVLSTEENILEIYQGNLTSLWSCIARIVLPDDIALCRVVGSKEPKAPV
jgi:hypothetical protein